MATEQKKAHEVYFDSLRSPKLEEVFAMIDNSQFDEAVVWLENFISEADKHDQQEIIDAYAQLIRISAETRNFSKIHDYIERVKSFDIQTTQEKNRFAHCLYSAGASWSYAGNTAKALAHFEASYNIAVDLNDPILKFKNKMGMAESHRTKGNYSYVLENRDSLESAAKETEQPYYSSYVYNLLGNVQRKQGNYQEAIVYFQKALDILENHKNSSTYHYTLWAMGTCYAGLEDEEKAKIYLNLATNEQSKGVEFWRNNVLAKMTLAELKVVVGKYDKAEELYNDINKLVGDDENTYYGKRLMRGLALLKLKEGKYDDANELIDRLVVNAAKTDNQREGMRLRTLKAEVFLRTGETSQHEQAVAMIEEALVFNQKQGMKRHEAVCLELLARLDSRTGYFEDAYKRALEMVNVAKASHFDRLFIRAKLITFVLMRKLGKNIKTNDLLELQPIINRLNTEAERVILGRFETQSYDTWSQKLHLLNEHGQRYVNEFFEDFHFVPEQSIDMEIDPNSHYVREKHLGEIPFHNKFTLMRLLLLLAETPGREYSKEEISEKIWQQEYNPLRHDNNIYININRLRKLIEPNPRESRYIMNGSKGYYFNPAMKVNFSTKISNTAPRLQGMSRNSELSPT